MPASAIILLIIALAYATATDLRSRRIPNKLTFPMLVGGLVLHTAVGGQAGLLIGLGGAGVALIIMIAPFALNWVGAGDVKLAMVVGVLMGPQFGFATLIFTSIVAGAAAVVHIARYRQLIPTAQYLLLSWHLPVQQELVVKGKLPYAPAMAVGCAITFLLTTLNLMGL